MGRVRSASWRLSLLPPSLALERPTRLTREPSARPRNFPSPRVRTRRTRTACPSWPASSRLRRLRRLPPSTWPSSARPSRSWRRPRRGPSSPWFCKLISFNLIPDFLGFDDNQQCLEQKFQQYLYYNLYVI